MRILIMFLLFSTLPYPVFAMKIGMNIQAVNYYNSGLVFTDLAKSTGPKSGLRWDWDRLDIVTGASYDVNGYPTEVPQVVSGISSIMRVLINPSVSGDYVMLYDGVGTFSKQGDNIIITSTVAGKVYFSVNGWEGSANGINILTSQLGDHVRNIRMIPIEYEGDEANMPTFYAPFLEGLGPFDTIRFMQAMEINDSPARLWADRTTTTSFGQNSDQGMAWEYAIDLCNELGANIWVNIPAKADDDYITQLATLLKSRLTPDLKIYLEYSNEIWNGGMFSQGGWLEDDNASDHTNQYVADDIASIDVSYGVDNWNPHPKVGYMSARCFRLFETVFGSADMASTVVRVAPSWFGVSYYSANLLDYLFNVDGSGADVLATGGYIDFSPDQRTLWDTQEASLAGSVTVDDLLAGAWDRIPTHISLIAEHMEDAQAYGIPMVTYEAGQHYDWRGDDTDSDGDGDYNNDPEDGWKQEAYDMQVDPEMYDLYIDALQAWEEAGALIWMAWDYIGPRESVHGSWGHLESYDQLDLNEDTLKLANPKYQALLDFPDMLSVAPDASPTLLRFNIDGKMFFLSN